MDYIKLQDQVKALKNLGEHLENKLKLVNFEVCDLQNDVLTLVDKCVDIQVDGNLNDLNLNYLREFYYTKKREQIETKLTVTQQRAEIKKLQHEIDEIGKDIAGLEKFTTSVDKRMTPAAVQQQINEVEAKSKALVDRQKGLKVPEDFNIEAVIEKIEMLERKK
ncbi:augmin complex subunit wac isoform X1 [Drosophila mojavensis]|uniref:augmin complex subunit wac isoform X1 n=1 Tax=Drosophila mojavensis TaxID=7230 RepID=UPI0013EE4132|nr:augmin complex subunit wac isoform X1 [Drosophila mojavensis]XP_032587337.1 augmin complex subunit wac isoform X1 [Drosophila mojavensis]